MAATIKVMDALDHQRQALAEIVARARAYFRGDWYSLPIQPRWASLVIGPTGTGKSTLAAMAAATLSKIEPEKPVSLLRLSSPGWMPCGAHNRSTKETIAAIAAHVAKHDRTILVIDELDKIIAAGSGGDSTWQSYLRAEVYDLIDAKWPTGLKDADGNEMTADATEELTTKLRETVLVLGIGTFQSWFDSAGSRRSMGFGAETAPAKDELTAEIIAEKMPRELANRFNSEIIRLPELQPADYIRIAAEGTAKLPQRMQEAFSKEVEKRIPGAIAAKKGVRFLEECMMATLIHLPPEPVTKTQNLGKIKIPPRPNLDASTP